MMMDNDDVRFASFTRDLARRHRRPRSFPPPPPVRGDALEQLCGGADRVLPSSASSLTLPHWPSDEDDELLLGEPS